MSELPVDAPEGPFDSNSEAYHRNLQRLRELLLEVGFHVWKKAERETTLRVYLPGRGEPLLNPRFEAGDEIDGASGGAGTLSIAVLAKEGGAGLSARLIDVPVSEQCGFTPAPDDPGRELQVLGHFIIPLPHEEGAPGTRIDLEPLAPTLDELFRFLDEATGGADVDQQEPPRRPGESLLDALGRTRRAAFDPARAQAVFEALCPDPGTRGIVMKRFADSIEEANRAGAAAWELSLYPSGKLMRLNVGRLVCLSLRHDELSLLLADEGSDLPLGVTYTIDSFKPRSVEGVRWYSLALRDATESTLASMADPHREAIRRSAERTLQSPYARWHSPGVVEFLAAALNRDLPAPSYSVSPGGRLVAELIQLVNRSYPRWRGFSDPRFIKDELEYKRRASTLARELLSRERLSTLLAAGEFDEIIEAVSKVARSTNLLYLAMPDAGDFNLFHQHEPQHRPAICRAIFELLHGSGRSPERLQRFADWAEAEKLPNKWTLPTYLLFVCSPETDFFVKPRITRKFARLVGWETSFQGRPEGDRYARLLELARDLAEATAHLGAKDMIDIQSLAWVAARAAGNEKGESIDPSAELEIDGPESGPDGGDGAGTEHAQDPLLRPKAFELLGRLASAPNKATYLGAKEEFQSEVEGPIQALLRDVAERLPPAMKAVLETEQNVFARFLKNDYGKGGVWPFYWGAFYPKGGKRVTDAQLFVFVTEDRMEAGFAVGEYAGDVEERLVGNLKARGAQLRPLLAPRLERGDLRFGSGKEVWIDREHRPADKVWTLDEWLADPWKMGAQVRRFWTAAEIAAAPRVAMVDAVLEVFERLFPLVLLTRDTVDPVGDVKAYCQQEVDDDGPETNPEHSVAQIAQSTGFPEEELEQWVRAIRRKGQAVIYGPPGTGKTFLADHLARHLVGGGSGVVELVQFHPAYSYEDFIQGIRPRTSDGQVTYELEPGRFYDFCRRAERLQGPSVLIIDEINRANLARVFGELMYLLEYRDREVPLAGGRRLSIPANVFVIGTMNTADRSIALVDHALRRRFAFLRLAPNYEVLAHFHQHRATGFDPSGLIQQLKLVNRQINDPHYEIGISFFLREDIQRQIEDIWRMEIVPYLEEFFFDQPQAAAVFQWEKVKGPILGG